MTQNQDQLKAYAQLNGFQRDMLWILAKEDSHGLGLKPALREIYPTEIHHGRLYPNLDALVEYGLLEKAIEDRRTNNYSITEYGRNVLSTRQSWQNEQIDGSDAETDHDAEAQAAN